MPIPADMPLVGVVLVIAAAIVSGVIAACACARRKKASADACLIKGVHVIVGDGSELFGQNVLIEDGVIAALSSDPIDAPRARVIDGEGKTLMPGLIDCHVHIQGINNASDEESDRFLYGQIPSIFSERVLPYGITTVKDLCAPRHFICKLKRLIDSGRIVGPELLVVGPNFTAPGGHPAATLGGDNPWMRRELSIEVDSPEQVSAGIEELKRDGVDFLKITYQGGDYWYFGEKLSIAKLDASLMRRIIDEGKENGLMTTAHAFCKEDVRELLEAGIYGIEHGILDEAVSPDDDIVALWKRSGARFVPTVNAMTYEKDPARLPNSLHNLKVLYDAGIPIAMGTDNMLEMMGGDIEHRELAYYVEAGLAPMQAITLATKNAAEHLGIADRKGCVKQGMQADLILLDKNPAEDISYIQFIDTVFLCGRPVFSQKPIQAYDIAPYRYPETVSELRYAHAEASEERRIVLSHAEGEREIVQVIMRDEVEFSRESCVVAGNLSTLCWHYERPGDSTDLSGVREDGCIRLRGTFKGKPQDKRLRIGDGLWYQMMDMAMPAFVQSDLKSIAFYSIGTADNRGAMGLGEFRAEKLGSECIEAGGVSRDCVKVSFVLAAFPWAWTGLYWYDGETGQMVQSAEKKGAKEKVLYRMEAGEKRESEKREGVERESEGR